MLPWYDDESEAERAAASARLEAKTALAKARTERVIAAYEKTSAALIKEARR
jgi:hypothetical protein